MTRRCALCDSEGAREVFRFLKPRRADATGRHTEDLFGRAGALLRCSRCGLVRQENAPEAPYEESEDVEYLAEERGISQTFRHVLDRIERHCRPPGRLLDIGCGPGLLLQESVERGWDAVGVEPSAWSVTEARRRGLDVRQGSIETAELEVASFNVVVATDVIEHVRDPLAFARRVRKLLAPGGVVFIATPNVESLVARLLRRWWWSVIPNHLWLFSPRTLDELLRRADLEPIECTTHPKTFSVEYYAARFGGYNKTVGRAARGVVSALGVRDRLVTPDFRDRIAITALRAS